MRTLLLRLAAPLQSWGDEAKFDTRQTWHEPSKSAVLGLIASALGYDRDDDEHLLFLNKLRFGVRIDQEGQLLRDFHTAVSYKMDTKNDILLKLDKDGKVQIKSQYVTNRYYLSDAVFVVGLESEDEALLQSIAAALTAPHFPLFLGRRSCPPTLPIVCASRGLTIVPKPLQEALEQAPWQAAEWYKRRKTREYGVDSFDGGCASASIPLRLVVEAKPGQGHYYRRDQALSFSPKQRRFASRSVASWDCSVKAALPGNSLGRTAHDPFAELAGE